MSDGGNSIDQAAEHALYLTEPGDSGKISPADIEQGQIGDCYFLSSLGEIAIMDPGFITGHLITRDSGNSATVHLYDDAGGGPVTLETTSFAPDAIKVTDTFSPDAVNDYNADDIVNGQKEIWPQVVEKAYGQDIGGFSPDGGYDVNALEALTGKKATYQPTANVTLKELKTLASQNALMVLDCLGSGTQDAPGAYNLIGQHAYMFDGLSYQNGQTLVNLINPWGTVQPDPVPFSQLAANLSQFTHGTI